MIINDKAIALKFGMYSFRIISEKFDKTKAYSGDTLNELGIAIVIHAGYLNHCVVKEIEPEISFEDIVNYVDERVFGEKSGDKSDIEKAIKQWAESQVMKKVAEVSEDAKKKQTGTKSKK